jgi:hypothetical protein
MWPAQRSLLSRCVSTRRAPGSDDTFLAYATASRVVGLSAWPVDGDPAHNVSKAYPLTLTPEPGAHNVYKGLLPLP